jgi:hypothetical protein
MLYVCEAEHCCTVVNNNFIIYCPIIYIVVFLVFI